MRSTTAQRLVVIATLICFPLCGLAAQQRWENVSPVGWSKIKCYDISVDELDLEQCLLQSHMLVNEVDETGPTRGFITLPVSRGVDQLPPAPHNERVMECHLTLPGLCRTDRPWHPYF